MPAGVGKKLCATRNASVSVFDVQSGFVGSVGTAKAWIFTPASDQFFSFVEPRPINGTVTSLLSSQRMRCRVGSSYLIGNISHGSSSGFPRRSHSRVDGSFVFPGCHPDRKSVV